MKAVIKGSNSLPLTAKAVKVTNIISPYFIRIYELENHAYKANAICKKLESYVKKNLNFNEESNELCNLGDTVIVQNNINSDIPAWWCRGILGTMNNDHTKYNVFIPDYGISLELSQTDFRKIPKDAIPDQYLTSTVSLSNIVPASVAKYNKSKEKTFVTIVEEWTESAICCTKELISAADRIFFNPEACKENGETYGEFYLIIEDVVVLLSKALIHSLFAVNLSNALLKTIEEPDSASENSVKKVNDLLLISQEDIIDKCEPKTNGRAKNVATDSSSAPETGTEERGESSSSDCMKMRKVHKSGYRTEDQQILVRSENKFKILENITDLRYPLGIHKALKIQNTNHPMRIQSYMWPAVAKGHDVIAVSPSQSGKTFGYVLPIATFLATQKKLPQGKVPTTLVLCSTSSSVSNIASLFKEFLAEFPHINVVSALNGKEESTIAAQIYNGCQVLVSTVPYFNRFVKKYVNNKSVIDLSYLQHIILDGGDVILEKYLDLTQEIFIKYKVLRRKEESDLSLQLIAVAEHWTKGLSSFMKECTRFPFICIGSYLEAAAFSQIKAFINLVKTDKNGTILKELDKQDTSIEKTMIICNTTDEAIELNDFLLSNNKTTLLAHNEMLHDVIKGIREVWVASVSGLYPILICTDEVLSDLNVKDVKWLIHHSINSHSKSRFYYRFSTIRDSWQPNATRCKTWIILDCSNNKQFQGVIEIMQRLHANLPSVWLQSSKVIAATIDRDKKQHQICNKVKALGFCPKKSNCQDRHCVLKDVDAPRDDIAIGDTVELMVIHLHNASHYSAKLVKCFKKDQSEVIEYSSGSSVLLAKEMHTYYNNVDNRRGCKDIEVGKICVMEDTIDRYVRVKVLKILSKNNYDEPHLVSVQCIDDGSTRSKIRASQLLIIPEELKKYQTNIVEVFLSGLEPCDKEYEWDLCANEAVGQWFQEYINSASSVIAKVTLHVGNTIWTNTLEIRTKVAGLPVYTEGSLRSRLIEKNHAVESKEHLPNLFQLCKDGKLMDSEFEEELPDNKVEVD